MIKEFAFSISNRHHFQDNTKTADWMGLDTNTFVSLYDYDEYVIEYYGRNKTLSGFDGPIYMPDEFLLDIDGADPEKARRKVVELTVLLKEMSIPYRPYFSGTGFHLGIPGDAFRWKPSKDLHLKVKHALKNAGIFEFADPSVTDKTRIIRLLNTRNTKSNLYKVEIFEEWLYDSVPMETIYEHAKKPQKMSLDNLVCEPVFNIVSKVKKDDSEQAEVISISQGRAPDPAHYTCVQKMLDSVPIGKRHMVALRIASHLRWRYPEEIVRLLMEQWRKQISLPDSPFTETEMSNLVEGCYTGHNGAGYRYGCNDPIMDEFCSTQCFLFKAKKSQDTMDAEKMEDALIDFYSDNKKPINIGAPYGQDFPVYPGEVVILQAPPASMKTMLLQNWMVDIGKPTYFLEMEMSPRQIWSRFVMIANNWTEDQLIEHYKNGNGKLKDQFNWLKVDFSSPYPNELEKRIITQPVMPELVIVDHIGLLRSKQKDNNMKVEEASQALMEIAVKHNIVVFAVSEINKSAFKEGMDMASSRGSFRIAYNANKLLSLSPYKNKETGLIEMLNVKSDKNREKEYLNVNLTVNNVRITNET
tara:strand:+ start:10150 stop:11904 length:1755 start_codon:yes stop_codon:yes gene_type:complete